MSDQVIEEVVSASRALAAGLSDKLKREQVWNDGQRQAGRQYLVRATERIFL